MELSQRFPLLSVLTESNLFSPLSILSPVFFFDRVQIGKDLRTLAGPPYVRAGAAGGGEAGGQGRLTLSTALREPPPREPPPHPLLPRLRWRGLLGAFTWFSLSATESRVFVAAPLG